MSLLIFTYFMEYNRRSHLHGKAIGFDVQHEILRQTWFLVLSASDYHSNSLHEPKRLVRGR